MVKRYLLNGLSLFILTACGSEGPASPGVPPESSPPSPPPAASTAAETTTAKPDFTEAFRTFDVKLLQKKLAEGADPKERDERGRTLLMRFHAAFPRPLFGLDGVEFWEALLRTGIALDATDTDGNSVLHYATRNAEEPHFVKFYLDKGLKGETKNKHGLSALQQAGAQVYRAEGDRRRLPDLDRQRFLHEMLSLNGVLDLEPLVLSPERNWVRARGSISVACLGGLAPCRFRVKSGKGRIERYTQYFYPEGPPGEVVLVARDFLGNEAEARVLVLPPEPGT